MQCKWSLIVIYLCLVRSFYSGSILPREPALAKLNSSTLSMRRVLNIFKCVDLVYQYHLYSELYYIGQGDIVAFIKLLIVCEWPLPLSGQVRIGE